MDDIVIFGAGDFGRKAHAHYAAQTRVVAFVDSDPRKQGTWIDGVPVRAPDDLPRLQWNRILVASGHAAEIMRLLETRFGFVSPQVFEVPISILHAHPAAPGVDAAELRQLATHLEEAGIPWWLDHSSLLGLLRDGDPCAIDIDLAIFSDHLPALQSLLASRYPPQAAAVHRYGFAHDLWRPDDVRQIKLLGQIDFHVKIRSSNAAFWLVGPMLLRADERFYDGCESHPWQGVSLRLPKEPRQYLSHLYGAWQQPAPNWTYSDYNNVARVFDLNEMQGDSP
jgi:hypothetical protein